MVQQRLGHLVGIIGEQKEAVAADNEDVHFTFLRYTEQVKRHEQQYA